MSEDMRADFEAWCKSHNESIKQEDDELDGLEDILLDRQGGVYIWANAESAWFAWQAAHKHYATADERMDVIARNGNTGEHYD